MSEQQHLQVAGLNVPPGERRTTIVTVPVGEQTVTLPLIAINGSRPGPRVTITGGVHGAEYVGIEAVRRLGELQPEEVAGQLVVVPVTNTTAFHRRSIYTSGLDNQNLNRQFPGNPTGEPSQQLAAWIFEQLIRPSDYYIDMHGGDMIEALVPFVIYVESDNPEVTERARRMAVANGIERVIKSTTGGSTYGTAAAAGIPAILAEIGGCGLWNEQEVEAHREGALRVLRHLGVLEGGEPEPLPQRTYQTFAWMRAGHDGLLHTAVKVGDTVQQGQLVGRIVDYFGNELEPLHAVTSGEIVFLVTSLAMNTGDPILAVGA